MDKPEYCVVALSGGKDSTAMLLGMLERGMQIDCILFCDTGLEFPAMYANLEKLEKDTGRQITRIRAEHSYEYLMFDAPVRRGKDSPIVRRYGAGSLGYGWPGIAADEQYRLERERNKNPDHVHPLVEWGMTEADCLQYCYGHGYDWNGLYRDFRRVSCWCCPLQSLEELRKLYRHYPALWEQLKEWDKGTWRKFRADYSVEELEKRFDFEDGWQKAGKPLRSRAFFSALKRRLETGNGKD